MAAIVVRMVMVRVVVVVRMIVFNVIPMIDVIISRIASTLDMPTAVNVIRAPDIIATTGTITALNKTAALVAAPLVPGLWHF